jgi:hypothetical protein
MSSQPVSQQNTLGEHVMTRWTFWQAYKATYAGGAAFLLACPLLALIPAAFEMLQHVVEIHAGMYESVATAQAADADPLRLKVGFLKAVAMTVSGYWIVRFLWRRDSRWARALDPSAVRLFSGYLAFQAILLGIELFAMPRTIAGEIVSAALSFLVSALTPLWGTAAALGNPRIGPLRSVHVMAPRLLWTLAFELAVMLPPMIPHYALAALTIGASKTALGVLLTLDAALVAYIAAVTSAGGLYAALRAADLAGIPLRPDDEIAVQGSSQACAHR